MPLYGNAFSASNPSKMAPGTSHDAGIRRFRNVFNLAQAGGNTTEAMKVAAVREGNVVVSAHLSASVSLAGINFTVGTLADPAKYGAAQVGPGAGETINIRVPVAALAMDALSAPEDIYFFPSAALPAAGSVVAAVHTSKR